MACKKLNNNRGHHPVFVSNNDHQMAMCNVWKNILERREGWLTQRYDFVHLMDLVHCVQK